MLTKSNSNWFFLALALAVTVSAQGQEPLNLHDCMEYAISNSTKMRIQQAAVGDAQIARRDAALALFTPQINAQTYAYYNLRPRSTTTTGSAPGSISSTASRR